MKKVKYNIKVALINYSDLSDKTRVIKDVEYIFDYDSIPSMLADGKYFDFPKGFNSMYDYFEEYLLQEKFERDKRWFNILDFKETII